MNMSLVESGTTKAGIRFCQGRMALVTLMIFIVSDCPAALWQKSRLPTVRWKRSITTISIARPPSTTNGSAAARTSVVYKGSPRRTRSAFPLA